MKCGGCLIGMVLLAGLAPNAARAEESLSTVPDGYRLVWSDEFDGEQLNSDAWLPRTTKRGKVSICRPENLSLADGRLRIACKREEYQGFPLTGGGAITRRQFRYGYYEVAARMQGGAGWHEAFWTTMTTDFDLTEAERATPRIEIDCFEHYADHDAREFSYGIIEWHPVRGGLSRAVHQTTEDLGETLNVFGFEFTPEVINFFYNGRLLETVDVRDVPHNPFHLWLSSIATQNLSDMQDGFCDFEYLRCYAADFDSPTYQRRRAEFLKKINEQAAPMPPSDGVDLWIQAEDFHKPGPWSAKRDGAVRILQGASDRKADADLAERTAQTMVTIPQAGRYHLWAAARDYAEKQPGARFFQVAVNGQVDDHRFGTHHQEGFAWERGGVYDLPAGPAVIELIDASRYFARCDRLLLTTDADYRPAGLGQAKSAPHAWNENAADKLRK